LLLPPDVVDAFPNGSTALDQLNAVLHTVAEFREELIKHVEPILSRLLQKSPPQQLESRRAVTRFLNKFLRENSLAISHPETGQPCMLAVHAPRGIESGMITLQSRKLGRAGSRMHTPAIDRVNPGSGHFQELHLLVAPREEPLSRRPTDDTRGDFGPQKTR